MPASASTDLPRTGIVANVRNRRGVIAGVEPFDGEHGRLHLVHIEYKDDQLPAEERLLWELEPRKVLLEPTALPVFSSTDPMPPEELDALVRASRWTATSPFLDPDGGGPLESLPISSPFHGALQTEDFQLVPLLKALRMPRVNLLIADDVGLGKTVEAGLIMSELLLRRRIQRILILTPASLRLQWRDEMWDKFSLQFDLVDRDGAEALRRRLGLDANPWRSFSRIIASYHYLRQDDILEQFLAASKAPEGSPHLPWDLLIVDECHNLMPSAFGDDSDLCRMLRILAPQFEHRLFLSATPHNGHTRCFTGLLEILDPVRFSQTDQLKPAERERVQQIVLRRLKRDINTRTNPPKFCTRNRPEALAIELAPEELSLSDAFNSFRSAIRKAMIGGEGQRRRAGSFAVEILGKRLLSCPIAFAESWLRCKEGLDEAQPASDSEVDAVRRTVERETSDDREAQAREAAAAGVVGAWLKAMAPQLHTEISDIDRAIAGLGIALSAGQIIQQTPVGDARFDALVGLIETRLRDRGAWREDERLLVFTEYKTTLDYLARRLLERFEKDRILTLFGSGGAHGMDESDRDLVKQAFNDPAHPVRVLLATDAAAEGLNLQQTARFLLHFDCPWNPSRLEQRNGRIDRHGQARDVTIHHFVTGQDQDLKFLSHVIHKADEIREDLGSANELFDEAAHRRLVQGESVAEVQADLDRRVAAVRNRAAIDADAAIETGGDGRAAASQIEALAKEIDLDPESLRDTLESALSIRVGRPQLECSNAESSYRVLRPDLPGWSEVIDDSLRRIVRRGTRGPVARLAFSPTPFLRDVGGRTVFSPRPDVALMHLSHPMLQRALSTLTRRRFPGGDEEVSRWTVRLGGIPDGVNALVLLTIEELALNELRETFHHWVRTVAFPIRAGEIGELMPHFPAMNLRGALSTIDPAHSCRARDLLEDAEPTMRRFLTEHAERLSSALAQALKKTGEQERKREDERYRSRQGEVSTLIAESTLAKLEREIAGMKAERQQGLLFNEAAAIEALDRSIREKQEEIARRTRHYEEVRDQLERERKRILNDLLPRRSSIAGEAQVFPVAVEVRLPGGVA